MLRTIRTLALGLTLTGILTSSMASAATAPAGTVAPRHHSRGPQPAGVPSPTNTKCVIIIVDNGDGTGEIILYNC